MVRGFEVDLARYAEERKKPEVVDESEGRGIEVDYWRSCGKIYTVDLVADLRRE